MKKIIAIPLAGGKLSGHFGHSELFAFITIENNVMKEMSTAEPPEHVPGSFPRWIASKGASEVIVGGIGPKAIDHFKNFQIKVLCGAPELDPVEIIHHYLDGKLSLSENNCDHDNHDHNHKHHHHGH